MRRRPPAAVVAGLALGLPLVVLLVRVLVAGDPSPTGDVSLIELRTRDVGTAHSPTLGSYGRYGFNHPGPLWFAVLALPYRLTGQLEAGVVLVGLLSLAAVVWVAHRRGALWLVAALTAVLVWGAGPSFYGDPWEPHGLLLPCAALLLLTIDVVLGRAWSLPLVVAVACVLGAAQATLLPFALAMGAVALARSYRSWRPVAASAAIALVLWSPTIWQQATGDPTNLTQMREAPSDSGEEALGLGGGWAAVALSLGHRPPWLVDVPTDELTPTVDLGAAPVVPIGALALLVVLARRRRIEPAVVVAVACVAGVVSLAQLLGPVFVWIPQWTRVLGYGCWLAVGWALLPRLPKPVLAAALAVVTVLATWDAARWEPEDDLVGEAVRSLVDDVEDLGDGPVLVTSDARADQVFGGEGIALEVLVLELEKAGVETVVDEGLADRYGPRRARPERAGLRHVALVDADRRDEPEGYTGTAVVDPLPRTVRAERDRLVDALDLPVGASASDILRAAVGDPDEERIARRLLDLPNLPRLRLLVRG